MVNGDTDPSRIVETFLRDALRPVQSRIVENRDTGDPWIPELHWKGPVACCWNPWGNWDPVSHDFLNRPVYGAFWKTEPGMDRGNPRWAESIGAIHQNPRPMGVMPYSWVETDRWEFPIAPDGQVSRNVVGNAIQMMGCFPYGLCWGLREKVQGVVSQSWILAYHDNYLSHPLRFPAPRS